MSLGPSHPFLHTLRETALMEGFFWPLIIYNWKARRIMEGIIVGQEEKFLFSIFEGLGIKEI